jgi:RNA polymerase sigma factor (sigma-70 family)
MSHSGLGLFIRRLHRTLEPTEAGCLADRELVERWVASKDAAAFETLVWRHGAMVLGTCRRLLPDEHDAEDAFQATFLLFLRKAGAIRTRDCVAGWLYRVAYRVALRARLSVLRQRAEPMASVVEPPATSTPDPLWSELRPVIDEELNRLSERERQPFILCYLQGMTNEEAARQLACPVGTIESRLARARRHLRARLTRRGLAPSVAMLSNHLLFRGELPNDRLIARVVQMSGTTAISPNVARLAAGTARSILTARLGVVAAMALVTGMVGAGGAYAFYCAQIDEPQRLVAAAPIPPMREPAAPRPVSTVALLDRAVEIMDRCEDKSAATTRLLYRLAILQARDGDRKAARATFARAEALILEGWTPDTRTFEWHELAKAQAEAGEVDAGMTTAARIVGEMRKFTVQEMATAMARAGNFVQARQVADKVGDANQRDIALMDIATALADAGDFRAALSMAETIKSPPIRVLVLTGNEFGIVKEFTQMGGIALIQAKAGDRTGARETLRRAVAMAEKIDKGPEAGKVRAWVARAEARLGEFATAKRWAERAAAFDKAGPGGSSECRDVALQEIAIAEAEAGRFDDALSTARTIKSPFRRVQALNGVAVGHARAGQRDKCRAAFAEAKNVAEKSTNGDVVNTTLYCYIVSAQANAGEFDAAEKTAALTGGNLSLSRSNIAYARARCGDFNGALKDVDQLNGNGDAFTRTHTLQYISQKQTVAGDERSALARAETLTSPLDKAATLLGVVEGRLNKSAPKKRPSAKP